MYSGTGRSRNCHQMNIFIHRNGSKQREYTNKQTDRQTSSINNTMNADYVSHNTLQYWQNVLTKLLYLLINFWNVSTVCLSVCLITVYACVLVCVTSTFTHWWRYSSRTRRLQTQAPNDCRTSKCRLKLLETPSKTIQVCIKNTRVCIINNPGLYQKQRVCMNKNNPGLCQKHAGLWFCFCCDLLFAEELEVDKGKRLWTSCHSFVGNNGRSMTYWKSA